MYKETTSKSLNLDSRPLTLPSVTEGRIETLRSLATLLLREVESLKDPSDNGLFPDDGDHIDLSKEMERFEIEIIRHAMNRAKGNQTAAAAILGTKLTTLHAKIKRYGIENFVNVSRM